MSETIEMRWSTMTGQFAASMPKDIDLPDLELIEKAFAIWLGAWKREAKKRPHAPDEQPAGEEAIEEKT